MTGSDNFGDSRKYLATSLSNIALFTALDIRSSMFSRGRVYVEDLKGNEIPEDPFMKKVFDPNYFQSHQDYLYQHLWFKSLGNNVVRVIKIRSNGKSNDIENVKSFNNLVPPCIDYNGINKINKMIISDSDYQKLLQKEIKYKIGDNTYPIKVEDLEFFYDVSNGMANNSVFKSPSRVEALKPSLANVLEAQKTKNINLQFGAKWIASNKKQEMNTATNLSAEEKKEIEDTLKVKGINATNADIKVDSLANDLRKLMLDDGLASDAMRIFSAYGINKDVLNWWMNGQSTYDNVEFGVIGWIQNNMQQEADDWANTWTSRFNYRDQGKVIKMDFKDLPIMKKVEVARGGFREETGRCRKNLCGRGRKF